MEFASSVTLDDISLILVDFAAIDENDRRAVGAVIGECLPYPGGAERGYNLAQPTFWVLAKDQASKICGARMVCAVDNDADLRIIGFGDLAVLPQYRRRGLAKSMTRLALDETVRRGADVLMTSTVVVAPMYEDVFGFSQPEPDTFLFPYEGSDGLLNDPNLWVRWEVDRRPDRAVICHSRF